MKLSVGIKILGAVAAVLVLTATAAVYSVRLLSEVEDEFDHLAHRQLPALSEVQELSARILEQGVALRRLFVLAEDPAAAAPSMAIERRRFDALDEEIGDGFADALNDAAAWARDGAGPGRSLAEITAGIEAIRHRYGLYAERARPMADRLAAGDRAAFQEMLPELAAAQEAIEGEVAAFRQAAQGAAERAAGIAAENERRAIAANAVLVALAAVVGFGLAALIIRGIVLAARNLASGMGAVEEGRLDTELTPRSDDELGYLTGAFNDMVGGLRLKERIRDTFGKYVDPRIVEDLMDRPEIARPGGERREMTVMFVNLRNFTGISERLDPDALVAVVNRYFEHVGRAVRQNDGVIDKFIGDAVMAYWGPPFNGADAHAGLACRAALQAVDRLEGLRAEIAETLGDDAEELELDLRIGVSTGEMIVGTVGSETSRGFTVMGDTVNLGARLEAANKEYGTHILVSEATRGAARVTGIRFREMDLLKVRGRTAPVRVYQLMGPYNGETGLPDRAVSSFETGLERYRSANWDAAANAFRAVLDMAPGDKPAETYLERIQTFRAVPPPEDWDGVWERAAE